MKFTPIPVQSLGRCCEALICGLPNLQHFYHWERLLTVFLVVKQQVVAVALGTSRNKVCCNDFLKPLLAVCFYYTTFLRTFYEGHCNSMVSLKFPILKDGLYLKVAYNVGYPIAVQSLRGFLCKKLHCGLPYNLQHFYHWEVLLTLFLV